MKTFYIWNFIKIYFLIFFIFLGVFSYGSPKENFEFLAVPDIFPKCHLQGFWCCWTEKYLRYGNIFLFHCNNATLLQIENWRKILYFCMLNFDYFWSLTMHLKHSNAQLTFVHFFLLFLMVQILYLYDIWFRRYTSLNSYK